VQLQAQALWQQAMACHQQGQLEAARAGLEALLSLQPAHLDAINALAMIAYQSGQPEQALRWLERGIAVDPGNATWHANRGMMLQQLQRMDEALASYERAIKLQPDLPQVHCNRGIALITLHRYEEALASLDRAIAAMPQYADAHYNRALALKELHRPEEALASIEQAIALRPEHPESHLQRGALLQDLTPSSEAIASYDRAIALRPDYAEAYSNRGLAQQELGRIDSALADFDRAIALQPQGQAPRQLTGGDLPGNVAPPFAMAHWNRALACLLMGDYAGGWNEYEWRWRIDSLGLQGRALAGARWHGHEPLQGRTILLHAEQGLGDTIQFCRYVPLVARLGTRVILEVQRPLVHLLAQLEGVAAVIARGDALPSADFHCPILSLPLAFGTRLDTIPAAAGYLKADPDKIAAWAERIGPGDRPRVGLVWSGNPSNPADRQRSIALAELLESLPEGFEYFSLQKEVRQTDRAALASRPDLRHFGEELVDFTDTAALCELMDVVASTCTSVAHLSGALGRPTAVLLRHNADWRWLLEREDSPWYASAKLYRQEQAGDWSGALAHFRRDLIERYGELLAHPDLGSSLFGA
jgi:hypothetical protein